MGRETVLRELLARGADTDLKMPSCQKLPLDRALLNGHYSIALALIRAGSAPATVDEAELKRNMRFGTPVFILVNQSTIRRAPLLAMLE